MIQREEYLDQLISGREKQIIKVVTGVRTSKADANSSCSIPRCLFFKLNADELQRSLINL